MKKILLSLTTLLFLFTTSAYSVPLTVKDINGNPKTNADGSEVQIELQETENIRVEQIVVPENERWMVERVLEQNPDLKEGDISRVEYSFGVYYGQISRKTPRVADGKGILGIRNDESRDEITGADIDYGIETIFKNGKLGKKSEQTILTNSGGKALEAEENLADEIKFHNQAFNNGFKIKADLVQLLTNDVINAATTLYADSVFNYMSETGQSYSDRKIKSEKFQEVLDFMEIEEDFYYALKTIDELAAGAAFREGDEWRIIESIYRDLSDANYNLSKKISEYTQIRELLPTQAEKDNPGSKKINLGEILRDAALSSQIGRLIDLQSKTSKVMDLLRQPEVIDLITFQQSNLDLLENINTLATTKSFLNKDKNFKEVRIVEGFNLRKNTRGTTIEAKVNNGTYYPVEYVVNDDKTFALQLTDEGKKDYENDKRTGAGGATDPSDGSGMNEEGGGGS